MGKFGQRARDNLARHENSKTTEAHKLGKRAAGNPRFLTPATEPYKVNSLPEVPFDIGEMYSGLVPINQKNKSEALFFVFQPKLGDPVDEITIWLNGGPGCSSLEGFFQENGLFVWVPGTFAPVVNDYSWVNLTNMLWVDQPIGTGYSIGTPKATTQEEIAQNFVDFFKNWEELFGIKNFKIYVTGESYAGRYVPYISAAMLDKKNKEYFDLSGALVFDPCIGQFDYTQEEVVAVPFVEANANLFNFNETFMEEIQSLHKTCGYADYIDKYLVFPPSGPQPPVFFNFSSEADCDVFDLINEAAFDPNPCFNIYEINQMCPLPWDVLGFPTELVYTPAGADVYFDRADVKKAMHAPDVTWAECSLEPVFVGGSSGPESEGDTSADPIQHVLPQVIEATNRVLVANGDYDMIIITNGTLMSIQNMTWNGKLGFQKAPSKPINITEPDLQYAAVFDEPANAPYLAGYDGPQGIMGVQHYERGLMWAETYMSGHMQPQFQPRVAYRYLQWVLGRVNSL
ncbi:putative pheromone processing carboxypeptidase [Lepidopterella palustris CBS 459.81]|uniref:Carboxypeptidase n=1 Tax=Lepidopterella palustris CBS 459.81 TaxID=1314670 RepID=A0A8E2J8L2_9PEZI|nr:putative pheromone processing carboxypeptidase [Lepidopterella palustris CBS 459.81]